MTAPRPTCRLIVSTGQPTVDGATIVVTACCDQVITHAVDSSGDDPDFDLTAWWSTDDEQMTKCRCGNPLPDPRVWRP